MVNRQLEAFGEKFTSGEALKRFRTKDYRCPFDSRLKDGCDKPNRGSIRYGNCSACLGDRNRIICPRRFYEDDYRILHEIRDFIWHSGERTDAYNEVNVTKHVEHDRFNYGNLDWVLVNKNNDERFIGVEIQADATTGTGSFKNAIEDLMNGKLQSRYTFGLNTFASFKGFLPQFILKGQLFDEWKMPYVAVMQDELWEQFTSKFRIQTHEITKYTTETFMFFLYSLDDEGSRYRLRKKKVMATRWIDLLFSFAVDGNLLVNYDDARNIIRKMMKAKTPVSTF